MSQQPLVSIIIRTKNEEKWIGLCLKAVFAQKYKNFEVIVVDNESTDQTVARAKMFPVKVLNLTFFLPGKAINQGINASKGEYIVCLSGHCIPVNDGWLEHLVEELSNPNIGGIYGRQEPLSFSSDFDKRDLINTFGLDKKIQVKDSFFHNANSAFRRELWKKVPFDEEVTNIEDRVWAQKVIRLDYKIVYQPEASVYHWHGIHQDLNPERASKIVKILEGLDGFLSNKKIIRNINDLNILAIIPLKGRSIKINDKFLLEYTIKFAKKSKYLKNIIVSTDNKEMAELSKSLGVLAPFVRPRKFSEEYVDILDVLRFTLKKFEDSHSVPDLVVLLEETYPFRTPDLLEKIIEQLVNEGLDTIIPVISEKRSIFIKKDSYIKSLDENFMPSSLKENQVMIGLIGLGCVTYPMFIRNGNLYNNRLGFFEITDYISSIQIKGNINKNLFAKFINDWDTFYNLNIKND